MNQPYSTWQPLFQAPDLVCVINTPNIDPEDAWVVCSRYVDDHHQEWFILRPGYSNKSHLKRIKVTADQMKRMRTN